MEYFEDCFAALDAPCAENVRHDLHEVLLIALCAVLCGGERSVTVTYVDDQNHSDRFTD